MILQLQVPQSLPRNSSREETLHSHLDLHQPDLTGAAAQPLLPGLTNSQTPVEVDHVGALVAQQVDKGLTL